MLLLRPPPRGHRAARWLQLVWEWQGYRSPAPVERILPHGMAEVSWNLSAPHRFRVGGTDTTVRHAALLCPRDAPYLVDTSAPAHLFGLVFQPGAAARLLGVGLHELGEAPVALGDFPWGAALEARLGEARSAEDRFRAAATFFAMLPFAPRDREATRLLAAWSGADRRRRSVRAVRETLGLSAPTFVDRVRTQLGLRPAQLRQVLMFREAVTALARGVPAARVARDVGYCDQAHLHRAVRRHAGLTPRAIRPPMPEHPFNLPEPSSRLAFDPRRATGPGTG